MLKMLGDSISIVLRRWKWESGYTQVCNKAAGWAGSLNIKDVSKETQILS